MLRTGEKLREQYIVRGDFTHESGAEAVKTLLALPEPPTAVFCHSDIMAIGAMWQAKNQDSSFPMTYLLLGSII